MGKALILVTGILSAPRRNPEMNAEELRAAQAPLKARYRTDPASALLTLTATGIPDAPGQVCRVETHIGVVEAGLHTATGGDGTKACSADMLLQALVGCAGVTLGAVATAMGIAVRRGRIWAEGDVDFRGTLGVSREAPVGFQRIRLHFDIETDAKPEAQTKLIELTERYCVVYQTLRHPPDMTSVVAPIL
jgi:uncharacterized OsmC-like protein